MNSVTHQSMPPTRVSRSRSRSSTSPSMGARAICMDETDSKRKGARSVRGMRRGGEAAPACSVAQPPPRGDRITTVAAEAALGDARAHGGLAALVLVEVHQAQHPRSEEHTSELQSREKLVC